MNTTAVSIAELDEAVAYVRETTRREDMNLFFLRDEVARQLAGVAPSGYAGIVIAARLRDLTHISTTRCFKETN